MSTVISVYNKYLHGCFVTSSPTSPTNRRCHDTSLPKQLHPITHCLTLHTKPCSPFSISGHLFPRSPCCWSGSIRVMFSYSQGWLDSRCRGTASKNYSCRHLVWKTSVSLILRGICWSSFELIRAHDLVISWSHPCFFFVVLLGNEMDKHWCFFLNVSQDSDTYFRYEEEFAMQVFY